MFVFYLKTQLIINKKKEIEKKLENLNVSSLQIRQQTQKMQEHVLHDAKSIIADESTMIKKYVEQIKPSGLIIEDLVSLGMDIVNFQPAELGD